MTREEAIRILRRDVLGTNEQTHEAVFMAIRSLKAEAEPFKAFARWVASEVCQEDFEKMWSLGAFAEVACRKLYALGVVQKFRDEWVYVDRDELDGGENG